MRRAPPLVADKAPFGGRQGLWWVIAGIVLLAVVYFLLR
jgi:hypothetical protein